MQAESLFSHMGCSLLGWQVKTAGLTVSNDNDAHEVSDILQKYAVPHKKERKSKVLRSSDVRNVGMILCSESRTLEYMKTNYQCEDRLALLGAYHPNKGIEIPDPLHFKDQKGYDKCYWLVYKSIKGLVTRLKEIDESSRPKNRIIRLPDPTVFTITSPSAWHKSKLRSPEISECNVIDPKTPVDTIKGTPPENEMSPPQLPSDVDDRCVKNQQISKTWCMIELAEFLLAIDQFTFDALISLPEFESPSFQLSPPQEPPQEVTEEVNRGEGRFRVLFDSRIDCSPIVFYDIKVPVDVPVNVNRRMELSSPQSPPTELADSSVKPRLFTKHCNTLLKIQCETNTQTYDECLSCDLSLGKFKLSPPQSPNILDDVTDKTNLPTSTQKNLQDLGPPTFKMSTIDGTEYPTLECNRPMQGRRPMHSTHKNSCSSIHILLAVVLRLSPPPLDLFPAPPPNSPTPPPRVRRGGDLFDDVRSYRKTMFSPILSRRGFS